MSTEVSSSSSTERDSLLDSSKEESTISYNDNHELLETPANTTTENSAVQDIKDAFQDHLEEANDADDFFLTMTLAKNLSILPSKPEMEQVVEESAEVFASLRRNLSFMPPTPKDAKAQEEKLKLQQKKKMDDDFDPETDAPPLSAYLTLISAVCALSSIGPFLAKQLDVDATMKIVWRFQGTGILLAPLSIHCLATEGFPRLSVAQWGTFVCSSASYSVLCVAFAMSIDYTTVSNATILTNSQSVLLVAAKLLVGHQVVFLEVFGVLTAFLGGILAAREAASDQDAPAQGWLSVYGDFLGLVSSVGGIGYIVLGKSLRAHFPVLLFMVMNMITASFIILLFMWAVGKEISWDRHHEHGVFGWMNLEFDRLPLEIMTVFVCNFMGTLGYVRAFKYFSSVIIAVAALLEPVVAAFTATAMGVGTLPGTEGWIGNILVIFGTLAVLYPTTKQGKAEIQKGASAPETPRTPYPRMKSPGLTLRPPHRGQRDAGLDVESAVEYLKQKQKKSTNITGSAR